MRVFIRNIFKYKSISALNILGLALGLAIGSIVFMFVATEFSYDRYHDKSERIYRIAHRRITNGRASDRATTALALAPYLKNIEAIEKSARFLRDGGGFLKYGETENNEPQFCFADAEAFQIFNVEFVNGTAADFGKQPNGLAITETVAKKYFGKENPIGKIMQYRNWGQNYTYQVAAVIKDLPENSHFRFNIFTAFDSPNNLWNSMHGTDWFHSGAWTYILLKEGAAPKSIEEPLQAIVDQHLPEELKRVTSLYLQPLTSIYLTSNLSDEIETNSDRSYVKLLAIIGVLILLLACVNFVNLSTARAMERSREVGVRKTLGASKSRLVGQFLGEAVLVAVVAIFFALVMVPLALPYFNFITGKAITISAFYQPDVILLVVAAGVVMGLMAGIYPAFQLSAYNPANVLRLSKSFTGESHGLLRRGLVIFQFTIAIVLLTGVLTINRQLNYIKTKDLGFDKKEVLFLQGFDFRKAKQLKNKLSEVSAVSEITATRGVPGSQNAPFDTRLLQTDRLDEKQRMESFYVAADYDFLKFFGIDVLKGRSFGPEFIADSAESIMVNEALVKRSGWSDDPIGKDIAIFDMLGNPAGTKKVVGVFKDFNFETLHNEIQPVAIALTSRSWNLAFRMSSHEPETLDKIRSIAKGFTRDGNASIETFFLDQDLGRQYVKEERLSAMIYWLTVLAIIIACIGLFGLSSFAAQRRAKTIAIRKVFGASMKGVAVNFTGDYLLLVFISFFLAIPLTYFSVQSWLDTFVYHVTQQPYSYFAALLISVGLAGATVLYFSIMAASANPVRYLKEE